MNNYNENIHKDKRAFERYKTNFHISLFYGNLVYSGIVTNISERGMFINTKRRFPVDTMLVTSLIDGEPIRVPVQIKRAVNGHEAGACGVGVHILDSSSDYLNLLERYRSGQIKSTS